MKQVVIESVDCSLRYNDKRANQRDRQLDASPMPTVLRVGRFRFFFFSNESQEPAHIHVKAGGDEAKFWLDPVKLAANYGFNGRELKEIQREIEGHRDELMEAWNEYFST